MRLPNGYGQIAKMSGARRRPYMARKAIGLDNKGRQVLHIIGYYATYAEALDALAKFNNSSVPTPGITLLNVYKAWYPSHSKQVSMSTSSGYQNSLRHLGSLTAVPIDKIKFNQLQAVLDKMSEKKLSYSSLKKVRSLIHQLYVFALINEWVDKNLASYLQIGKNTPIRPHKLFKRIHVNRLWKSDVFDRYIPLILLYSGMRSIELRHLKKSDVKVKQRVFDIHTSKTKAGIRIIPIHEKIWPFVEYLLTQPGKYLLGELITYAQFARRFKNVMCKINADYSPHDCRHTFATWLDDADANYNAKRRLLGHAANNVTDGVYTHKTLPQLRKAIKLLK